MAGKSTTDFKEFDKFDIVDLAIKHKLKGSYINVNGEFKKVKDYYLDFATQEVHILFYKEKELTTFNFRQKHIVRIKSYKSLRGTRKQFVLKQIKD